jgi:hypothetical protein
MSAAMKVRKVSATTFRDKFKDCARKTKGSAVLLVENRRLAPKYFVDKAWLDSLIQEYASVKATAEILADRELTGHLLKLAETIDDDVRSRRIHLNTMKDVFGAA